MIAYSYAALGDSVQALESMNRYFDREDPSEFVAKDFELKAKLLEKTNPPSSGIKKLSLPKVISTKSLGI